MFSHYVCGIFIAFNCMHFLYATNFFKNGETSDKDLRKLPEASGDAFYYFSYGCDMLASYLETEVSAFNLTGPALLRYHRLDFNTQSTRWNGALATIVIDSSSDIYGTLWKINLTDLNRLNLLESTSHQIYIPYRSPVIIVGTPDIVIARTYHLKQNPIDSIYNFGTNSVPFERLPSRSYLKCMVKAAEENGLPSEYVNFLRAMKNNGRRLRDMENQLDLKDVELKS